MQVPREETLMRHVELWVNTCYWNQLPHALERSRGEQVLCNTHPKEDIWFNEADEADAYLFGCWFWRIDGVSCLRCLAILRKEFGYTWEGRDY